MRPWDNSISGQGVAASVREVLEGIAAAVHAAVEGLQEDRGKEIRQGADGSPTALVDLVAEEAALAYLDAHDVAVNVLSEEAGFVDRGGRGVLVVDPVDGTHNAIRGIPGYTVSLAVGKDRLSDITHGLVRDLVRGDVYYAERGGGAFLNGRPIRVAPFAPEDTVFLVYLGMHADPRAAQVAARARRVRVVGAASLDMCLVARGAADLYYMHSAVRRSELRVVDVAAATLIVREAGGRVTDLKGAPLDLPFRTTARSNLLAYGDPRALEVLP
jgi:fructose-1,6-bisphosphatase/inositol monophosphatase family enzyme